jgi:site-specific DNA recombinase
MKVYQYIRISDKDQSNCSIDGQQRFNALFAEKHGMEIIETFIDDGVSAKDFNRPAWRRMEHKLKYRAVEGVIVWKYDRMIRNVMEGLMMIDNLERKYSVVMFSAMETFSISPSDPMFFKIRADILVTADFERRIITDRTKFGIWSAKMQGKYIGQAPLGYVNARDERNKPIILIDEKTSHIIEYIFNAFSLGQSIKRIHNVANELGMNRSGHSVIRTILENPVYKGFVLAPKYKDSGEKLIQAIHEPIVSRELWDKCNGLLQNEKVRKDCANDDVPLRGLARCACCGDVMTGGRSKGRSKFYYYYRCAKCNNVNYNAQDVHKRIISILNEISLSQAAVTALNNELISTVKQQSKERDKELKVALDKLNDAKARKERLEAKYIDNLIDHETYTNWSGKLNKEIHLLNSDLHYLSKLKEKAPNPDNITKLVKLGYCFEIASTDDKQELCRYIFNGVLLLSNQAYRTAPLAEIFRHKRLDNNVLEIMDLSELSALYPSIPESTRNRTSIEPLLQILHNIAI